MSHPTSSAEGVAWNLDNLYTGLDDPRIKADLAAALKRASGFRVSLSRENRNGPGTDGRVVAQGRA